MGNSITQKLKYKQRVIKFSFKYGIIKAAIKFEENRRTIYRWIERYDGTLESLKDKSKRPHSHLNEHTEEEIKMIRNYKANNKETKLVVLWIKLRNAGYYPKMRYPGEKIQIDVKYVPKKCLSKEIQEIGKRYYQYTAID